MHALASFLVSLLTASSAFVGGLLHTAPQAPVAGTALPQAAALFETSLAGRVTASDTSMSLVSNSVGGSSIAGYTCFTIDEGRTDNEFVCGTVSGTSVTSLERGVSYTTGTTTSATRAFAHRVGANVKITDFPLIQRLKAQANGEDTYPNILHYTSHPTFVATTDIVDKKYVDDTAFSGAGVIDATTAARGFGELATPAEVASSTAQGGSGVLLIPASAATSTYNAATAPLNVVVTGNNGKIDNNFIATSTLFTSASIATSTMYQATNPALGFVGKYMQVFSSTGTTTFSVPTGVTRVFVTTVGGGAGGGSCSADGTHGSVGGGGGAGGTAIENVDVTGTSTIQVHVGTAAEWSTFGTNGFYNSGGAGTAGADEGAGGAGGAGSGGDINLTGGAGSNGRTDNTNHVTYAALGGASFMGVGGNSGGTANNGGSGGNYGGGGGGGACDANTQSGGAGAQGIVIVRW